MYLEQTNQKTFFVVNFLSIPSGIRKSQFQCTSLKVNWQTLNLLPCNIIIIRSRSKWCGLRWYIWLKCVLKEPILIYYQLCWYKKLLPQNPNLKSGHKGVKIDISKSIQFFTILIFTQANVFSLHTLTDFHLLAMRWKDWNINSVFDSILVQSTCVYKLFGSIV